MEKHTACTSYCDRFADFYAGLEETYGATNNK